MRNFEALTMMLILLALVIEPAWAIGLGATSPCVARNPAEIFCLNQGGCPKNGYCYFPDGSYCELWSFYNGTCPGRAYYEQAMWEAEMYNFLYGDEGYYPAYQPAYWPYGYDYYWPRNWGPRYGPYWSDPLNPIGW